MLGLETVDTSCDTNRFDRVVIWDALPLSELDSLLSLSEARLRLLPVQFALKIRFNENNLPLVFLDEFLVVAGFDESFVCAPLLVVCGGLKIDPSVQLLSAAGMSKV